jgi:hypothetical protein
VPRFLLIWLWGRRTDPIHRELTARLTRAGRDHKSYVQRSSAEGRMASELRERNSLVGRP